MIPQMKELVFLSLLALVVCSGCSGEDGSKLCGNGNIDEGETCDGNCAQSCNDSNACTIDTMSGRAENCDVECRYQALTGCFDGDGCCPADCSANNDDDCSSSCGNDEIEEGETCDPPATCPADCDDDNDCTNDLMTGSPGNCNVVCANPVITQCHNGDGCCPAGCNQNSDGDCSASCGNNEIEDGETCDPPATCPTNCTDGDVCTEDLMTGSPGNCNVVCANPVITQCHNGDGCCPQNCTSTNDDDCGGGEVDCQFDPAVSWHVIGEILQMESADGGTCVWLRRRDLCPTGMICMAHPFLLLKIRIGHDGRMVEISDTSKLSWSGTHHNWEDVGTAETDTTTYTLTGANYGWAYNITASGGENWGPILLEAWEP